jgi:hypothetical protein
LTLGGKTTKFSEHASCAVSNQDQARMYGEAGRKEQEVETSSIVA